MEVHILASGSDGNCAVIRGPESAVMVDAGISCKRIMHLMDINGIDASEISGILVTHEHTDHVSGVGPVARKFDCPVFCTHGTYVNSSKLGKVDYNQVSACRSFSLGGMDIMPLPTSHNAAEPVCYRISSSEGSVLIATDTGTLTPPVKQALADSDVAVIESNYDRRMLSEGPYPYPLKVLIDSDHGHMSNYMCADAIKATMREGRKIFLAHLSKTNNTPDVAKETVEAVTGIRRSRLDCLDPTVKDDTRIIRI